MRSMSYIEEWRLLRCYAVWLIRTDVSKELGLSSQRASVASYS
jgi:hypothetical protein